MSLFKGSPYHRDNNDLEAGRRTFEPGESSSSSIERLRKQSEEEEKQLLIRKVVHVGSIEAAKLFRAAGKELANVSGTLETPLSPYQLAELSRDQNVDTLQGLGGVKGLSDLLKTNLEKGIKGDNDDLRKRKSEFGLNTYPWEKGRSFWMFLWEAWQNLTLITLMVAAVTSLALGIKTQGIKEGWYDGGSIAFAVILVIVVKAISDYRQSLQFQSLNEAKRNIHLEVIRSGRRIEISIYDIVVGDVVPLNIGDQVPANGVLISGHSLAIDESSMTRERKIVHKDSRNPFLFSGFKVADGSGTMLVTSVGNNTEWGTLMASISEDTVEETPLQGRLNGVATLISKVEEYTVAVCVLIVLLVRYFTGNSKDANENVLFIAGTTKVGPAIDGAIQIVNIAVTIVLVAVPKGLPLAVPLTLAYFMRKMMADKALVRRLSACETMGSATTICCHTGTLTLNMMIVVEACVGGKKMDFPDSKVEMSSILWSLLFVGIAQNTNGSVVVSEGGGDLELFGSPTEKAILSWGVKLGMNFEAIRSEFSVFHVFPFNSEKKRGGIALKLSSQALIHWKGAAEIVLASCTQYIDVAGQSVAMDEDKVDFFKKAIESMAACSLRCVAFAYRFYDMERVPSTEQELSLWALPEDDLVLLAIVGIKDPCRPVVKDAVQLCQNANIKVRMVTGENLQTAKEIALKCGILDLNEYAYATEPTLIEGRAFRAKTDLQREEIVDQISVMGRSSPNDKLLLVQALRKKGHVVAVTGDGANDAAALLEADIGLAMGISGTEVAKESSDIVILDDNFVSVVKVVRWGRSVYANIQKFIQFHLTVNVAALIINVVAAVSSGDVPLNAVQLLWVNLIMDTLGPLALVTEPPTDRQMDRPPFGQRESPITNIMLRNSLIQALYQVTVLLVLSFQGGSLLNMEGDTISHALKVKNTMIFNSFVLLQIFNVFNARKPNEFNVFKGITRNYLFMRIVGVTVVLQVIIIEFLGKFTSTVRLTRSNWLISVIIGFLSWPLAVLGKLIPVPKTPIGNILARFYQRGASQSSLHRRRD